MLKKTFSLILVFTLALFSIPANGIFPSAAENTEVASISTADEQAPESVNTDDPEDVTEADNEITGTGAVETSYYRNGCWYDENNYALMTPNDTKDFSIPTAYSIILSDISVSCGESSVAYCSYKTNNVFTIKAKSTGTSTVHASVSSSYTYYDASLKRNITYTSTDYLDTGVHVVKPVTSLSLEQNISMIEGDVRKPEISSVPDSAYSRGASNIRYSSSKTSVVKVNAATGEMTAQGPGTATITASSAVAGNPSAKTTVTVTSAYQTTASGSGLSITKYLGSKSKLKIPTTLNEKQVNQLGSSSFKNVTALSEVTVPAGVTKIGASAFSGCSNLKSVFIPRSVTEIGAGAFSGCSTDLTIECAYDSAAYRYAVNNGISYTLYSFMIDYLTEEQTADSSLWGSRYLYDYGGSATSLTLGKTYSNVSGSKDAFGTYRILEGAFRNNKRIKRVDISKEGVLSIGDKAFEGCSSLEVLKVDKTDVVFGEKVVDKSVVIIGYKDSTAEKYALSNGNPFMPWLDYSYRGDGSISIKALSDAYDDNGTLVFPSSVAGHQTTEVVESNLGYPRSNTLILPDTLERIGYRAFINYPFTRVYLGKSLKEIGDEAFYNTSITSVELPDSLEELGAGVFEKCTKLKTVKAGEGLTSIGGFIDCSSLERVILGSNITTIRGSAFWHCKSLACINLENVSSEIGYQAFWGCTNLRWFTLSDQLKTIGQGAFEGANVTGVIIPESVTEIGKWAFGYTDVNYFQKGNTYVSSDNKKVSGYTINGWKGSAAESYAYNCGLNFVDLSSGAAPVLKHYKDFEREIYVRGSSRKLYCYTMTDDGTPINKLPGYEMSWFMGTKILHMDVSEDVTKVSFYDSSSKLVYGPVDIKYYSYNDIDLSNNSITQSGDLSYIDDKEPVDVSHVALNKTSAELSVGGAVFLTATVTPSNADEKSINWSSSNSDVAKVDSNGKVTAVKSGAAYIMATASDYLFAFCRITVKEKPAQEPTQKPTQAPTQKPTQKPTQAPTQKPTQAPTQAPTQKQRPNPPMPTLTDTAEGVRVTWEGLEGVHLYRVYYLDENDSIIKRLGSTEETTYLDTEAEAGKTYRYSVGFYWEDSQSFWYGTGYRCVSHTYTPPAAPTQAPTQKEIPNSPTPTLTDTTEGVRVTWEGIEGVNQYRVYYLDENDKVLKRLATVNETTYLDTEAEPGQTYRYSIGFFWEDTDSFWYGVGSRCISHTYTPPAAIRGDADCDGEVSITDATWIQRSLANLTVINSFNKTAADADGDGEVSVTDATWIQRKLANIAIPYPVGETIK